MAESEAIRGPGLRDCMPTHTRAGSNNYAFRQHCRCDSGAALIQIDLFVTPSYSVKIDASRYRAAAVLPWAKSVVESAVSYGLPGVIQYEA